MQEARILIMDDEAQERRRIAESLRQKGYDAHGVASVPEAVAALKRERFDVFLTDCNIPGVDALRTSDEARRINPDLAVIIMTAFGTIETAVKAIKAGAYDYLPKPVDVDQVALLVERIAERQDLIRENTELKEQLRERYKFDEIVSTSHAMEEALNLAGRVASSNATVLLRGESGTGKELVAKAIHYHSPRADQPLVKVNCAALPETLLESELFGHEKGAFTGAVGLKRGLFEIAAPGTVFLNEIGHMPPGLQAKLLRVIEDKTFKRVGGREDLSVDVRVIAATNEDLEKAVTEKRFRADLYYRLNVLTVRLPPLRERPEDIAPLIESLLGRLSRDLRKPKPVLSEETRKSLLAYAWPGNVRELRNVLERMMILGEESAGLPASPAGAQAAPRGSGGFPLPEGGVELDGLEKDLVRQALERSGGNQQQAGRLLGISRDALRRRIEKFGLK